MLKHPAARVGPASKVLRPAFARILTPVVEALARTPITPNALTIIGTIGMSAGALALFPTGHLFIGVVVCTGFVFTDMLDGQLARIKGTTGKFGAFLDSTMDRVDDAAVFDDKVKVRCAKSCGRPQEKHGQMSESAHDGMLF